MGELVVPGIIEFGCQGFGRRDEAQVGQVAPEGLVGLSAHRWPLRYNGGRCVPVINGGHFVYEALVGREVDHDVGVVVGGQHLGRLGRAAAEGGRLALRRHGAAVLNWASTAFSRAALSAGPRTTRPAPGVARPRLARTTRAAETTSTVPEPSRCRTLTTWPENPGGTP